MKIKKTRIYQDELHDILIHIAKDKISASLNFRKELNLKIKDIPNFPYKYRKSFYFNEEKVRDMIFMGYTIIFEIKLEINTIEILSIFNQNKPSEI